MGNDEGPVEHGVQVVDPEVRAYVYSLVTAVSGPLSMYGFGMLTISSWVDSMARMRVATSWEMTPWPVYVILRDG